MVLPASNYSCSKSKVRVGLTFSRRGENLGSLFRPFLSWSTTAAILWRWIAWIWRVEAEINVVSHCDHDFSLLSRAFSSFLNALSFVAFIFSFFFFPPLLFFPPLSFIVLFLYEELYFITEENEVVTKEKD